MSNQVRTSPPSDHRRRPRKRRPPTSRDQAIFVAYRTQGRTQAELAKDFRLSQSRVSAILRRLDRLVQGLKFNVQSSDGRSISLNGKLETLNPADQLRLDRWMERERAQGVFDRAIRAFDTDRRELKTIKEGHRDGKPYKEESCRQQPASTQLLRIARQANNDLGRIAEREPIAEAEIADKAERRRKVEQWLGDMRHEVALAGIVARDPDDHLVIRDLIKQVLGEPNCGFWQMYVEHDRQLRERAAAGEARRVGSAHQSPGDAPNTTVGEDKRSDADSNDVGCDQESARTEVGTAHPTPDSVPGSSRGPHNLEAPASPADSKASNCSNPALAQSTKDEAATDLAASVAKSKSQIKNPTSNVQPCSRPIYHVDGCGWQPTVPDKEEEARRARAYLDMLRAQNEANMRVYQEWHRQTYPYLYAKAGQ